MAADVVSRIQKLLKLSRRNSSPEEAASAAAMAQELMFKYSIGEAELADNEDPRSEEEVVTEDVGRDRKAVTWKGQLASALARSFGARMFYHSSGGFTGYRVVALRSVSQTVAYMFSYLVREVNRLADEAWKGHQEASEDQFMYAAPASSRTWKNNFRLGAVKTIAERLAAQRAAQVVEVDLKLAAGGSAALALYKTDQQRQEEAYASLRKSLGLRPKKQQSFTYDPSAYEQGQEAGRGIGLSSERRLGAPKTQLEE